MMKERKPHEITIAPTQRQVSVRFGGKLIARTSDAVTLREGRLPPVHYLPLEHVRREYLVPSDHSTHCPFKGDARYYDIVVDGRTARNAVWFYADPLPEVGQIAGRVAFYPDRVDSIEVS